MDIEFYNKYLASIKSKDRITAKKHMDKFIKSFANYEEKEAFTKLHLSELENKGYWHIRHELFVNIVFPVLLNGYNNKNIESMIWIIKFIHIFWNHKILWEQIGKKEKEAILNECYEIDPNNDEVNKMYMEMKIKYINNKIYWMNERKKDINRDGNRLLEMINNFKNIDKNKVFENTITECENIVKEYIEIIEKLSEIKKIILKN